MLLGQVSTESDFAGNHQDLVQIIVKMSDMLVQSQTSDGSSMAKFRKSLSHLGWTAVPKEEAIKASSEGAMGHMPTEAMTQMRTGADGQPRMVTVFRLRLDRMNPFYSAWLHARIKSMMKETLYHNV
jgi:hypothetical protein